MKIKNIMNAVEAGNFHNTLMDRLSDLELKQQELEGKIVAENLKKPEFTQEHIEYWLRSFKDGSIDNIDYVKGVINSFVNSIFVYDAKKDEDRRIVIALNLTDSPVKTLKSSDICYMVDQKELYPNFTLLRTIAIYVFCR